ncbi:MAG: serine/threonine-protein kinase [Myxococcales bacterium]
MREAPQTAAPTRFGKYELVRPLAKGGMAEVFLARQVGPGGVTREVVVKRVLPELSVSDDFVTMFLDEARLAVRLSHPNVVQVFDFGELDGSYFLVLERLTGLTVESILTASQAPRPPVPERIAALIAAQACDGLHYVHSLPGPDGRPLRVVHRDVSPANLFVTDQGVVKVLDFGIAKAESNVMRTQVGMVKGKVAYMAPEQLRQQPLDARADVFALGAVLHELLAGARLFRRKEPLAAMRAILKEPIPSPSAGRPGLSPKLSAVAMRALARAPDERYPSAAAMRADLDLFLAELPFLPPADALRGFLGQELPVEGSAAPRGASTVATKLARGAATEQVLLPPELSGDRTLATPNWRRWLPFAIAVPFVVGGGLAGRYCSPFQASLRPLDESAPPAAAAPPSPAAEAPVHLDPAMAKRVLGRGGLDMGVLQIDCVPKCHVYVDGQDTGQDSPTQPIYVPPGPHRIRAVDVARYREKTLDVKVTAGAQVVRTLHL